MRGMCRHVRAGELLDGAAADGREARADAGAAAQPLQRGRHRRVLRLAPDSYKTGASRLQVHPFDASRMTSAGAVPRSSNLNDAICMTSCGASPSPHRARSDCRSGRFLDIPWQSKGPAHPFILFTRPPGKAETVLGRRTR